MAVVSLKLRPGRRGSSTVQEEMGAERFALVGHWMFSASTLAHFIDGALTAV
jgi:hypothetical protein